MFHSLKQYNLKNKLEYMQGYSIIETWNKKKYYLIVVQVTCP